MKKYFVLLFISIFIISCWKDNEKSIIKETWEIVDDYVETLETTPDKAREVKKLIESNQNKLLEDINNIR